MSELKSNSRRDFLKKSAYVVPVVMTLKAAPSLAGQGSYHKPHEKDDWHKKDKNKYNKKGGKFNKGGKNNKKGH
jgi:hypothetical protein